MLVSIDWISFTSEFGGVGEGGHALLLPSFWVSVAAARFPEYEHLFRDPSTWEVTPGRAPYSASITHQVTHVRMFYSPAADHVLFELSGRACELLRNADLDLSVLARHQSRITRVDVAFDIYDPVSPQEFVETLPPGRFKSRTSMTSLEGDTEYIGSRKSDRYCRCYRYKSPHPRAAFLRVEVVLKQQQARVFAEVLQEEGFDAATRQVAAIYPFSSDLWTEMTEDAEALAAWRPDRRQGGTVRWLFAQVLPAVRSLVNDGNTEDVHDFMLKIDELLNSAYSKDFDSDNS